MESDQQYTTFIDTLRPVFTYKRDRRSSWRIHKPITLQLSQDELTNLKSTITVNTTDQCNEENDMEEVY